MYDIDTLREISARVRITAHATHTWAYATPQWEAEAKEARYAASLEMQRASAALSSAVELSGPRPNTFSGFNHPSYGRSEIVHRANGSSYCLHWDR